MNEVSSSGTEPESADRPRPMFSRFYARVSPRMEDEGMSQLRGELLADLTGTVVEVGCGNGLNFAHYPPSVDAVIAVEPEPRLRAIATKTAATSAVPVNVIPGIASRLPLADDSADAAVLCLVMCSLDDRSGALAELRRVLRPGGTLHFLEHTLADGRVLRTVQRIADATIWPLLTGGCHTATNPAALIEAAGYTIVRQRQLRFPDNRFTTPATPHVLGTALR